VKISHSTNATMIRMPTDLPNVPNERGMRGPQAVAERAKVAKGPLPINGLGRWPQGLRR
jgi:hypothetical protein